jgi:hypothetical protein
MMFGDLKVDFSIAIMTCKGASGEEFALRFPVA